MVVSVTDLGDLRISIVNWIELATANQNIFWGFAL